MPSRNVPAEHDMSAKLARTGVNLSSAPAFGLILGQALITFADTALLLIAIISVQRSPGGNSAAGAVQQLYILPFLLLAPFVGALANTSPIRRILLLPTVLKIAACAGLAFGVSASATIALLGISAAIYSPAKYSALYAIFDDRKLVMANALVEGSAVLMAVSGTMVGGLLANNPPAVSMEIMIGVYFMAALLTLAVPRLPPERSLNGENPLTLLRHFGQAVARVFAHQEARFSLVGTSVLFATGTTLRLLILAWAPAVLPAHNKETPMILMAAASLGVIVGAMTAGRLIPIQYVNRALVPGLVVGILIALLAATPQFGMALALAITIGACAGAFVVPLNALLQKSGALSVGTGYALAIQNFSENLMTFVVVEAYSFVMRNGPPIDNVLVGFGGTLFAAMLLISWMRLMPRGHIRTQ